MTDALANQQSPLLKQTSDGGWSLIPDHLKDQQNYRISRINLPSIRITEKTRDQVLMAMNEGKKYVQLGQITLMINTITTIDPYPLKRG